MMDNEEIWIPSKTTIRNDLVESLKTALQASKFKSVTFRRWIKDNNTLLDYIGKEKTLQLINQVAEELELDIEDNGDYVKRH